MSGLMFIRRESPWRLRKAVCAARCENMADRQHANGVAAADWQTQPGGGGAAVLIFYRVFDELDLLADTCEVSDR
jgi:hypothetical protein